MIHQSIQMCLDHKTGSHFSSFSLTHGKLWSLLTNNFLLSSFASLGIIFKYVLLL